MQSISFHVFESFPDNDNIRETNNFTILRFIFDTKTFIFVHLLLFIIYNFLKSFISLFQRRPVNVLEQSERTGERER